jgi:hypothetical protein
MPEATLIIGLSGLATLLQSQAPFWLFAYTLISGRTVNRISVSARNSKRRVMASSSCRPRRLGTENGSVKTQVSVLVEPLPFIHGGEIARRNIFIPFVHNSPDLRSLPSLLRIAQTPHPLDLF